MVSDVMLPTRDEIYYWISSLYHKQVVKCTNNRMNV